MQHTLTPSAPHALNRPPVEPHTSTERTLLDQWASFDSTELASILVADPHEVVFTGLKSIMDTDPQWTHRVQWHGVQSMDDATQALEHRLPSLVLLDLHLPDSKGLAGLRTLISCWPKLPVVAMSGTSDDFVVAQALSMGAKAFLPKTYSECQVRRLIGDWLLKVTTNFSPGAMHTQSPPARGHPAAAYASACFRLGPRQLQVLDLILSGCTNDEIARETRLKIGTVKNYVSSILAALDVKSRAHLVALFH